MTNVDGAIHRITSSSASQTKAIWLMRVLCRCRHCVDTRLDVSFAFTQTNENRRCASETATAGSAFKIAPVLLTVDSFGSEIGAAPVSIGKEWFFRESSEGQVQSRETCLRLVAASPSATTIAGGLCIGDGNKTRIRYHSLLWISATGLRNDSKTS
jgi:hypothetical protein